jgi:hypothetical protein
MRRTLTRALVVCAGAALFALASAQPASACSCAGFPTFADLAREAPLVVVGRVAALGELKWDDDPASITLAAERTVKGAVQPPVVVVWNEGAGSSCGGLFSKLAVGTSVAVAVVRVADVDKRLQEMWPVMDFHPAKDDLLVALGCGMPMKVFASDRDRDRWLRRQRH